jgi:hypothetical protein
LNATRNPGDLRRARTAISKRIRRQSLNDAFILLIPLSRGILIVLPISLFEEFSARGRRENITGLRIQTAAKGVNDFVIAMRLFAGPLDIRM